MNSLAQQALEIYDQYGEATMRNYALYAAYCIQDEAPFQLWRHSNTQEMGEHSHITRHRHDNPHDGQEEQELHYHFRWPEGKHSLADHIRKAELLDDATLSPDYTLLVWPNTWSIMVYVLERAFKQATESLGRTHDDYRPESITAVAIAHTIAPSLRDAVTRSIFDDRQPDAVMDILDSLSYDYADDAILYMGKGEFQKLVDHYVTRLSQDA